MEKDYLNQLIGEKLRSIRLEKGLSLDRAAELTGVSKPMLGQIERARSNPTVSTLWKIAEGLKVPFTAFIEEKSYDVKSVKKTELSSFDEDSGRYKVYPIFPMNPDTPFEIYEVDMLPCCDYLANAHPAGVIEHIWVTKGCMTLKLKNNAYTLKENEGLKFTADQAHRYVTYADESASFMMAIYYPSEHS